MTTLRCLASGQKIEIRIFVRAHGCASIWERNGGLRPSRGDRSREALNSARVRARTGSDVFSSFFAEAKPLVKTHSILVLVAERSWTLVSVFEHTDVRAFRNEMKDFGPRAGRSPSVNRPGRSILQFNSDKNPQKRVILWCRGEDLNLHALSDTSWVGSFLSLLR